MTSPINALQPRADRFRVGDVWRGSDGRDYSVQQGVADGLVTLRPVSRGVLMHSTASRIVGFRRIEWGGQS